jgi:DHA3 family macrolide efflux protein-like MFS transporter
MPKDGRTLNRNLFLLWQGQLVSLLGTQVFRLALVVWLKQAAESATLLGLLMATFVVPGLIIGPFGGVIADRYPRRLVLVACDLVQGAAVLSLGILWFFVPASHPISIAGLFVLALIMGSTAAVFQPATVAFVPELVPREGLPRANSLIQGSFQTGALIAQSLAGVSFRVVGASALAILDAGTYLYSALSSFLIKTPPAPQPTTARTVARRPFRVELRAALTYVRSTAGLMALMLLSACLKFFMAPFPLLFAFYVEGRLHSTTDWYGFLIGALGLGAIVGVVISGALKFGPRRNGQAIVVALITQSLALTALSLVTTPRAALALVLVSGVLSGFLNVRLVTLLQLAVAPEMRGRVFGVLRTVTEALVPIATILAGIIADLTGRNVPLVYAGCGIALTCISIATAVNPACRAFLTGAVAPSVSIPTAKAPVEPAVAVGAGA